MLIDWFTVLAQIVNFLALVALLKHFLFGRLVKAIDEREKKIAGCLAEAEGRQKEAERQLEQERERVLEQERRREELLAQARREADQAREEMIQKTRAEVRELERKWGEDLERERGAFLEEVRRRSAQEILAIVRRALADLASSDVQHAATAALIERLHSFDAASLRTLTDGDLAVLTPGELGEQDQRRIREVLEQRLGGPVPLRFVRAPEIGWGIELRGHGRRIGWNSGTYVEALEERLREALDRRGETVVS